MATITRAQSRKAHQHWRLLAADPEKPPSDVKAPRQAPGRGKAQTEITTSTQLTLPDVDAATRRRP